VGKKFIQGIFLALFFLYAAQAAAQPRYNPSYDEMISAAENVVQFDDLWQVAFEGSSIMYPSRDYENQQPLTGTATKVYEDGRKTITEFKNGRGNGLTILWHANGKKAMQGTLVDGDLDGILYQWDEGGNLVKETPYKAGKIEGAGGIETE
jgi:type IV secretory pathway VirB9-like protein